MPRVFVYGTLQPGERNFNRYCSGVAVSSEPAKARGCIYELPAGYPAMTIGEGWVQGYVLCFEDAAMLSVLDELEGYVPERLEGENEYYRVEVETYAPDGESTGRAWAYAMSATRAERLGGVELPGGTWPVG
jgi:gamma-glutamylcyclotransferase (GGCT)/AIG2-like uncharacterized protein YtfP